MNAIVLGMALLVSSTEVSPTSERSRDTVVPPAFTFDLPDGAATSRNLPHRLLNEQSRPVWRRASLRAAQATTAKRFAKTDRIIAVVAAVCGGWLAGGVIGYALTSKPDDDVSGLRGVMIGAPVGAVIGAVAAYRLTK
ncbi:MAG: hypothetical protein H0W08_11190 [Acidobacteria bacterium]|nr:hypothetical protein [Acidobacteriota bacterium]